MTDDLYPTPTRLALLADVDAGHVWQHSDGRSSTRSERLVTAAIKAAESAGWVVLRRYRMQPHVWYLTDAGRAVLDQHRRADT